jgi:microcystin degradation protein MlrC
MRVGILGLLQESNTFLAEKTGLSAFKADVFARGEEVRDRFRNAEHEIGGFFSGLEQEGIEPVPLFVARALPYGDIEADAFSSLVATMLEELQRADTLDGLLVAPHGATVSEGHLDADGFWLARVREHVRQNIPIVGTLDPHANLSDAMIAACDALIAYRTNPHIDQRERGEEAARLLARSLREEVRPCMAALFPPMAISIECQATDEPPCQELWRMADELRNAPGILSASILFGFPYADVHEMGSSAIVVADGDHALAQRHVEQLGQAMWQRRTSFVGRPLGIDQAIDQALTAESPVCLLDMGDNVGGGSPADSTWLARALWQRRVQPAVAVIYDPDAVRAVTEVDIGSRIRLHVGGRSGPLAGEPLAAEYTLQARVDGRFSDSRPLHGGFTSFDQGPTAVLTADAGLTIVVTSRRMVPFSLGQLTSCGLDPASFRVLVAKGVNAPIAAYREICRTFIRVNTPGVTAADMTTLGYTRRRRPMFPFEPECRWSGDSIADRG